MRPGGPRDLVAGPDSGPEAPFPLILDGKVIKGFGRGSKELGIPTANIPLSGLSIGGHDDIESGVYFGWAGISPCAAVHQHPPGTENKYKHMAVHIYSGLMDVLFGRIEPHSGEHSTLMHDRGAVYPMVISIGYNPFYKNTVRSVEVHVMHSFEQDFYGAHMNLNILGFIRPEYDYVSKESLVEDIKTDIDVSGRSLARKAYAKFAHDKELLNFEGKTETAS